MEQHSAGSHEMGTAYRWNPLLKSERSKGVCIIKSLQYKILHGLMTFMWHEHYHTEEC